MVCGACGLHCVRYPTAKSPLSDEVRKERFVPQLPLDVAIWQGFAASRLRFSVAVGPSRCDVALQAWIALVNVIRTSLVRGGLSSRRLKVHHETAARRTCFQLAAQVPGFRAAPVPLLLVSRSVRYPSPRLLVLYEPKVTGMSKYGGESRTEIGERLVARVEFARARYESLCSEAKALRELADACLGNSDKVFEIRRYRLANQRAHEAMNVYHHAIQDLNDFVLRGKMPTDSE